MLLKYMWPIKISKGIRHIYLKLNFYMDMRKEKREALLATIKLAHFCKFFAWKTISSNNALIEIYHKYLQSKPYMWIFDIMSRCSKP